MRESHIPADNNYDQYHKDIEREKKSLWAVYTEHHNSSVFPLIEHMAEALAYQYSLNRQNNQIIKDLLPDRHDKSH